MSFTTKLTRILFLFFAKESGDEKYDPITSFYSMSMGSIWIDFDVY